VFKLVGVRSLVMNLIDLAVRVVIELIRSKVRDCITQINGGKNCLIVAVNFQD